LPLEAYNYPDVQETSLSTFLANPLTLNYTAAPIPNPLPEEDTSTKALFEFFSKELGRTLPYVDLFETTAATWFSTSVHNPALRQAVLAIRLLTVDPNNHDKANEHLQWALTLLRRGGEVGNDGGGVIGYFLCAHFSMMLGNQTWARDHLRALKTLVPDPLKTDKLTKLIWHMAIRIDFMASIASGKPPILPKYQSPPIVIITGSSCHSVTDLVDYRMKKKGLMDNGSAQILIIRRTTPIGQKPGWPWTP